MVMTVVYTVAFFLLCSLIYSIIKLIKLYIIKAENKRKKEFWNFILYQLLLIPAIFYTFYKSELPPKEMSPYENGEYIGGIIGSFIGFYIFAYLITYCIPWLISLIRKKEISANILAVMIVLFWLPTNLGSIIIVKSFHDTRNNQTEILTKIQSYAERNQAEMAVISDKKIGFNLIEFNNTDDISSLLENGISTISEAKVIKNRLQQKIKKIEKLDNQFRSKIENFKLNDDLLEEIVFEFFSKCEDWSKINKNNREEFIAGFKQNTKKSFDTSRDKMLNLMVQNNISSPLYFKLAIYKKALEIVDLYISFLDLGHKQNLLTLEQDIISKVNIMNEYIEKENAFYAMVNEK